LYGHGLVWGAQHGIGVDKSIPIVQLRLSRNAYREGQE